MLLWVYVYLIYSYTYLVDIPPWKKILSVQTNWIFEHIDESCMFTKKTSQVDSFPPIILWGGNHSMLLSIFRKVSIHDRRMSNQNSLFLWTGTSARSDANVNWQARFAAGETASSTHVRKQARRCNSQSKGIEHQ